MFASYARRCTCEFTFPNPQISSKQTKMTSTVLFDKFPSVKLIGGVFEDEVGFDLKKMAFDFRIVRVHGRVRWKDHGSGEACAMLILKRGFLKKQTDKKMTELDLAKYARGSSPDETTTVTFDLEPDDQNPFWQTGGTGKFRPDLHSRNSNLTMSQILASQQATTAQASRLFCTISSAMKTVSLPSTTWRFA